MESAGNGTDADYRSQLSALYNSSSFCNFTDSGDNSTGFTDVRCGVGGVGGDSRLIGRPDGDANPIIIAIVITALYSIVCVVGLVGNVLVMYIIVR